MSQTPRPSTTPPRRRRIQPAQILLTILAIGLWLAALRVAWIHSRLPFALVLGVLLLATLVLGWLWRHQHHGLLIAMILTPLIGLVSLLVATFF